jgi:nicotinate-nucleotide adenylyltransferase
MRLAILGGSFNPVHLGHLFIADAVLNSLNYDRVVLVPAYRSPFKLAAKDMESTSQDRLEMLAASIAGDPRLTVDDCEIRREGVSYTVDTVQDIIRRYAPDGKPGLIIGDDLTVDFLKWHNSDEILRLADIIVTRRIHPQGVTDNAPCSFPHTPVANEIMDISSQMVRQRISEGGTWRYLVPAAARSIIEDRRLYGYSDVSQEIPLQTIVRLEQAVREELSHERFLHSRHTAILSYDLCRRFGLDPRQGYLAGIAHDLGKYLKDDELLALAASDGRPISKLEKKKPSLLHGRATAVLLRKRFTIKNPDILEAVAMHTEGGEHMCPLAKIVYIADKVEFSRDKIDPDLRAMCYTEEKLDDIFMAVLNQTVSWLRSHKIDLSMETLQLLENLQGKKS